MEAADSANLEIGVVSAVILPGSTFLLYCQVEAYLSRVFIIRLCVVSLTIMSVLELSPNNMGW